MKILNKAMAFPSFDDIYRRGTMFHFSFLVAKWVVPLVGSLFTILLAVDGYQVAAVITAIGTLVGVIGGIYIQLRTYREVKTINSKSLANLADATEERRIADIPEADRTLVERSHMVDAEKAQEKRKGPV